MFLLWVLVLIAFALVLKLRTRVQELEGTVGRQQDQMRDFAERLRRAPVAPVETTARREADDAPPRPAPVAPQPPAPVAPPRPVPVATPPPVPADEQPPATIVPPPVPVFQPYLETPQPSPEPFVPEPEPIEPAQPSSWNLPQISINWEELVGVKLFSAVAGIALVLAGVFFLGYSIEHGWLQPPVRVAIGIIVATALLVVCELKAARKYALTANALDAASIAILFSTFYAAHTLWNLIGATLTFGLLILVTVLAVTLAIRHESRFIAVLGLLGGFVTPALLSTGENRPIPLFTYLLVLNAGLAWVAFKKGWPLLTILTLILTAVYQWSWVVSYLDASQLSLGMGIFVVFAVMSFASLVLSRRGLERGESRDDTRTVLERTGAAASMMPLVFAIYLAAVRQLGVEPALLFGFLFVVNAGLLAIAVVRREELMHAMGALATLLVFAAWIANASLGGTWLTAMLFVVLFASFYLAAPMIAARVGKPFEGSAGPAIYAAPILLFVFPVLTTVEATAAPWLLFGTLYALLALLAWRALAIPNAKLYFISAFFALAAEASWSAYHLVTERLGTAVLLYTIFGIFYLGLPIAARRLGKSLTPRWGPGAVVLASLLMLLQLAAGPRAAAGLWGMAFLLALLNAGLFIESAAGRLPGLSIAGSALSWLVLGVWWGSAAATVGLMPSLMVLVGLTLVMFAGYAWAHAEMVRHGDHRNETLGFPTAASLGLVGHGFILFVFLNPEWSNPPWPALGALLVMTLAASATALFVRRGIIHAAAVTASAVIVGAWVVLAPGQVSGPVALVVVEAVIAYAVAWLWIARRLEDPVISIGALAAVFIGEFTLLGVAALPEPTSLVLLTSAHASNLSLALWLSWRRQWSWIGVAAVVPAWLATIQWQDTHRDQAAWSQVLALATSLYAVFVAYPMTLGTRARESRDPYLTAIAGSVFYLFVARSAFLQGELSAFVGIVPVVEGIVMALLLRTLLRIEPRGGRDLARLALVAGSALAFATVAIPLQLRQQWITIGWALEGAALAWLYRRIPHRGLLYCATALLSVAFVRLALNPAVFVYEPRGGRVFNWYLYAYAIVSMAILVAAWWLNRTDDRLIVAGDAGSWAKASKLLPPAAVILLFLLLNIEIADFYATGPEITFRFGVTIAQDLTYTVGWLIFGLILLAAGIYMHSRTGRMAAVAMIAITMFKAFLYDMGSLGGLYRVASLVGLAISLALVAVALQKFVLQAPKEAS